MAVTADASVTFWYGCNMARHGEIVRLVTHILEAVGVEAAPAGGPGYCCGSTQERPTECSCRLTRWPCCATRWRGCRSASPAVAPARGLAWTSPG